MDIVDQLTNLRTQLNAIPTNFRTAQIEVLESRATKVLESRATKALVLFGANDPSAETVIRKIIREINGNPVVVSAIERAGPVIGDPSDFGSVAPDLSELGDLSALAVETESTDSRPDLPLVVRGILPPRSLIGDDILPLIPRGSLPVALAVIPRPPPPPPIAPPIALPAAITPAQRIPVSIPTTTAKISRLKDDEIDNLIKTLKLLAQRADAAELLNLLERIKKLKKLKKRKKKKGF